MFVCVLNAQEYRYLQRPEEFWSPSLAVLNLWVMTSVCVWGGERWNDLFTGVVYQISCISDIYIIIYNSSKNYSYEVVNENNFMLWGHHNMRN